MSNLVKKAKLTELDVNSLATKTAITAVENKIPSVSSLVEKKQTMTQKLLKLKRNLLIIIMTNITTPEFNTLAADVCNARLAQANLINKQILMLNYGK